jgi:hypothetical protein
LVTEPEFKVAAGRVGDAIKADIADSILVDEMEAIAAAGRATRGKSQEERLRGTA